MEFTPPLGSCGIRGRIARVPIIGPAVNRLLDVPDPFFHKQNSPAKLAMAQLYKRTFQPGLKPRVLNIGSRTKQRPGILNLDIVQNGNADVLADAARMPFADASFDLITNIAVMEHTKNPHLIASECCRVLKPGGRLYCAIPFFQMYHPDPIDMQRYTVTGIANLFKELVPVESGVELGPSSTVVLTLREYCAIAFSFNSTILYNLLQVFFGYLFYPIKFLDYFLLENQFSFMIACSVYFIGEKR
jgi:SAM-dependent methyltransferase